MRRADNSPLGKRVYFLPIQLWATREDNPWNPRNADHVREKIKDKIPGELEPNRVPRYLGRLLYGPSRASASDEDIHICELGSSAEVHQ